MWRRTVAIARAEWIHNRRDPRSLFVIVALPILLLVLYGYGINFDLEEIPFAVYDLDGSASSREIIDQFRQSRYFSLRAAVVDRRDVDDLLDRGQVVFVLAIPPDHGRTLGAQREAKVQVILDGSDTTRANTALGYIQAGLQEFSARLQTEYLQRRGASVTRGLVPRPTILFNPGLKSTLYIVPGLIAVILALVAALLTSTCIVREREWGSFETLVASPVRPLEILIGKLTPYIIIAFCDVVLSIVVGAAVFGVRPLGSVALLLGVSVIYLLVSLAIGLLFSALAPTQQLAILLPMVVTLLPTILLSGFVFPTNGLPTPIRLVSYALPATHFLLIIRGIYLKGIGAALLWKQMAILSGYAVLLLAVAGKRIHKRIA